jgi:uncharacterized protein YecE (DUF72 family)
MNRLRGLRIGTCSWNDESWVGLVYSAPSRTAAGYLGEYSKRFRTAEVDSFFYKLPEARDALSYAEAVDEDFSFTLKVTQDISLTHARDRGAKALEPNPSFLSAELFASYLERVRALQPMTEAVMLEFEYLNKDKMRNVGAFMEALDPFVAAVPAGVPLAIETRNKNYLTREYFQFLKERSLIHVFSEKQYMPHVYEVYEKFGDLISGTSVIRLLGGDRAEIERATGGSWNRIVDAKPDKLLVAGMSREIVVRGGRVIISINNHYEGSAPMTALFFEEELGNLPRDFG